MRICSGVILDRNVVGYRRDVNQPKIKLAESLGIQFGKSSLISSGIMVKFLYEKSHYSFN